MRVPQFDCFASSYALNCLSLREAKYIIANNLPANDAHWDSDDPSWVGKASMSKRHRFLIRRNLHWRWFNALVFGGLPEFVVRKSIQAMLLRWARGR